MCKLCDAGQPHNHFGSRRNFLKGAVATGVAAAGLNLFAPRPAAADGGDPPLDSGRPGRRYVIRGGSVMSLDPQVGDFAQADVLVEGKKILAVGPNLHAGGAAEIDATGRIVMPGFIDTHHHQFETVLRSFLADGVLINDGSGTTAGTITYYEYILLNFAPVYRPQDVYINELFGALSQLDDGVTTVHDVSQIHHTPQHSDAAIQALFDTGRRSAFGYFEGAGNNGPNYAYPQDAFRIKAAILLLDRPARHDDHGRRGLPRGCRSTAVLEDRAPARSADCGAHPFSVRDTSDPEPARRGPRRQSTMTSGSGPTICSST